MSLLALTMGPLARPLDAAVASRRAALTAGPILVVDDDEPIAATMAEILSTVGYKVEIAEDGKEALRAIEKTTPSLILLDMRMPVMNGWDFAAEARRRGITVPIVVVTAAESARRWAQEIGATGYLAKPFDLLDLLEVVRRYGGA